MTDSLTVALVQAHADVDPAVNRGRLAELVPEGVDLAVLPEVFARDFGAPGEDVSADAEPVDGPFAQEVARVAAERGTTVLAGMFETSSDPARPFNTLVLRGAATADYRKIHLYDSFGHKESDRIMAGPLDAHEDALVRVGDFTLGLMTCYDLRFPELSRRLVERGADVLVLPAAWVAGERKVDHWRTLVRARAIENTVHVVAVGQPAPRYTGHSLAVDPMGDVLAEAGEGEETCVATLTRSAITEARRTNPSLDNRRM